MEQVFTSGPCIFKTYMCHGQYGYARKFRNVRCNTITTNLSRDAWTRSRRKLDHAPLDKTNVGKLRGHVPLVLNMYYLYSASLIWQYYFY